MEGAAPRRFADRGYLVGLVGVLAMEAGAVVFQITTGQVVPDVTVIATAFAILCMVRIHGLRGTMAFVALVFAIPYASEFVGVLTGVPYGTYEYTGLRPWLFGLVPFFIFIAWINVSYLTIATTTLGLGRSSLWLAPLDGILAAAWDVIVDPLAVRAGYWAWASQEGFYGVPLSNFLGWFLVVTVLSLAARSVWSRDAAAPVRTSRATVAILPALLLGSSVPFAALAVASGMPLAALVGLGIILPAVSLAGLRLRAFPAAREATNPWSALPSMIPASVRTEGPGP